MRRCCAVRRMESQTVTRPVTDPAQSSSSYNTALQRNNKTSQGDTTFYKQQVAAHFMCRPKLILVGKMSKRQQWTDVMILAIWKASSDYYTRSCSYAKKQKLTSGTHSFVYPAAKKTPERTIQQTLKARTLIKQQRDFERRSYAAKKNWY